MNENLHWNIEAAIEDVGRDDLDAQVRSAVDALKNSVPPDARDGLDRAVVAAVDFARGHARRYPTGGPISLRLKQEAPNEDERAPNRYKEVHVYLTDSARGIVMGPIRVGGPWRKRWQKPELRSLGAVAEVMGMSNPGAPPPQPKPGG